MSIKKSLVLFTLVISVVLLFVYFLIHTQTPAPPSLVAVPNCLRLHAGNTYTDLRYDPKILTPYTERDKSSHFALFRLSDIQNGQPKSDALFVFNVWEDFPNDASNTVEAILRSNDNGPGPKYNQRATIADMPAALATPSVSDKYFIIPFGDRAIHVDYIFEKLTPEERKAADEMLKNIKIFSAATDISPPAKVESCTLTCTAAETANRRRENPTATDAGSAESPENCARTDSAQRSPRATPQTQSHRL